jgi:hypothetical protein
LPIDLGLALAFTLAFALTNGFHDAANEIAAKRELYRRLARTGDDLREVAERVWYAVLKES